MNRPIRSILRHAAQGFALGHVSEQEYRNFRRRVLEAILSGEQPPTVPIHWLQSQDARLPAHGRTPLLTLLKALGVLAVLAVIGAGAVYYLQPALWEQAEKQVDRLLRPRLDGPLGDFQGLAYELMDKDVWTASQISLAMKSWDQLSPQDRARAREHDWFRRLRSTANQRVSDLRALEAYTSDKESLRSQADAIHIFAGALASR